MELNPGDVILTFIPEQVLIAPEAVFHSDESSKTCSRPFLAFSVIGNLEDLPSIKTLESFRSFFGVFSVFAATIGIKC